MLGCEMPDEKLSRGDVLVVRGDSKLGRARAATSLNWTANGIFRAESPLADAVRNMFGTRSLSVCAVPLTPRSSSLGSHPEPLVACVGVVWVPPASHLAKSSYISTYLSVWFQ